MKEGSEFKELDAAPDLTKEALLITKRADFSSPKVPFQSFPVENQSASSTSSLKVRSMIVKCDLVQHCSTMYEFEILKKNLNKGSSNNCIHIKSIDKIRNQKVKAKKRKMIVWVFMAKKIVVGR